MMTAYWKRGVLTLAILLVLLLVFGGALDRIGDEYTEQGLKRALVAFAIARGLNGVISVAQGTEVALQPAGIGVNFTPGQILDPVNDLVERFSWVMLLAATSLGIQKLLLGMFSVSGFNQLLGLTLLAVLVVIWSPRVRRVIGVNGLLRMVLVLLLLRFAVPVAAVVSEQVYAGFMQGQYEHSAQVIEQTTADISRLNRSTEQALAEKAEDLNLLESARRLYQSAVESLNMQAYVERYQSVAEDVSEQVVNLIVIFILQTILLPLLYILVVMRLLKWVLVMDIEKTAFVRRLWGNIP